MNAPDQLQQINTDIFITVPETTLPHGIVVPAFRVGQYLSSQVDGKLAITADRKPWVRIAYDEARSAAKAAGYQLITELQWLALAWDASQQDCNWTGGKVGEGELFRGLRNGNVNEAQAGDYAPADPDERRWLTLSNGARICDMNGNAYSWVFDDVQGGDNGIIARDFAEDSPSITTAPYPSGEKGMGDYEAWDWSGLALIRGGCWCSGSDAGVFGLGFGWPGGRYDSVGFRCTQPMEHA